MNNHEPTLQLKTGTIIAPNPWPFLNIAASLLLEITMSLTFQIIIVCLYNFTIYIYTSMHR